MIDWIEHILFEENFRIGAFLSNVLVDRSLLFGENFSEIFGFGRPFGLKIWIIELSSDPSEELEGFMDSNDLSS